MTSSSPALSWGRCALLLALPLLGGCALFKLAATSKSHPDLDGSAQVEGISGEVMIRRDSLGVPHIEAEAEADGWFGLGYVHAQDRLFQADIRRRLVWGRLSEWLGEDLAELDSFFQTLELREHAERAVAALSDEERAMAQAYVDGFNAGAASLKTLPIEHRLLGAELEPYTLVDLMATPYAQAWNLAANPSSEAFALIERDVVDVEHAERLLRLSGEGVATEAAWDEVRKLDIAPIAAGYKAYTKAMGGFAHHAEASNNWVVGPSRSANGGAMVANDPHLGQSVPSLWYVAHIKAGDVDVAGVTLAGVPGVVIGHNDKVAWGLTNVMADVVDLAVLERDGEDGVIVAGEREQLAEVRGTTGGEPFTAWKTSVGPVVSELSGTHLVALRWTALDLDDRSMAAFLALNRAGSVAEGLSAFQGEEMVIAQNIVLGDTEGDFAWQQVGSIPRREGFSGRVPALHSDPEVRWAGYHDDLPGEHAPERGTIHTANSKPDDPRADFGAFNVPAWRYARIAQLFAEEEKLTVEDMTRIQNDQLDLQAQRSVAGLLEGVTGSSPQATTCRGLLSEWDHVMAPDSAGAAVWALFQRELVREVLRGELGPEGADLYVAMASSGRNITSGEIDHYVSDRAAQVDTALGTTCTLLEERLGADPAAWTWGALHPLKLQHPFARSSKLLSGWNMEEVPWHGSGSTVSAAGYSWGSEDQKVTGMVSMRIVMPLADLGSSTVVHPGGQSGQPKSELYRSHFDAFVASEVAPLWYAAEDVERETVWTLTLQPTELPGVVSP